VVVASATVVKVCTGTFVITVSNFVHCILVDLTVVGLAKCVHVQHAMAHQRRRGTDRREEDLKQRHRSLADRRHFVDFKMGSQAVTSSRAISSVFRPDVYIAEGMYAMIIAEMEHINVIRKRLEDDEGIIDDGFNNDSVEMQEKAGETQTVSRGDWD
jgi:hypothetical protein